MARVGVQEPEPFNRGDLLSNIGQDGYTLAQPKLNGLHLRWDGACLFFSGGNRVKGTPHIVRHLQENHAGVAMEGEAYCHGWTLAEIAGVVTRHETNLHPDRTKVAFYPFDLISQEPQAARLEAISRLTRSVYIRPLHASKCTSFPEVVSLLRDLKGHGYEGLILRRPNGLWKAGRSRDLMKWKPGGADVYTLIRCIPDYRKYGARLGALLLEDRDGNQFERRAIGLSEEARRRLWSQRRKVAGRKVLIRYNRLSPTGAPLLEEVSLFVEA